MSDLNRLTATEAAREIAAGRITSEDLVRDCLGRIAERDAEIQAWVHCDRDAAIAAARAIDKSDVRGPLRGVPIAFKDVIDTCDMPAQYNSPIYSGYRPKADAACAAMVRHAGGIVLGKTVTTEFASHTPGPTRNPHNTAYSPGGSSSGSAAAVADFMVPLGFGTQTGGSTIRPASFCGIVGYKPSFGTINRAGLKFFSESLDTIGVLGRSVEDCALLVHAVSSRALPDFDAARAPRIGLVRTSRWKDATDAMQSAVESAAAAAAKAGGEVRELELPADFDALYDTQILIMNYEAARALAHERYTQPGRLSDYLRKTLDKYWDTPRERYDQAMRHARACRQAYASLFEEVDVLLTPSAPGEAPKGITSTGNSLFNRNWTLLGAPCVTIPHGTGPAGLPLGVQIVGAYDDDARVLLAAQWLTRSLGGAAAL